MKNLAVILLAGVLFGLTGCSNSSSSPVSADAQAPGTALDRRGVDDQTPNEGGGIRQGRLEGRVNAVNAAAGTVTIGTTVVRTNAATKIERNGFHATLAAFRVGDFGQARLISPSLPASKVEARGQ